jgi:hypothetical protein
VYSAVRLDSVPVTALGRETGTKFLTAIGDFLGNSAQEATAKVAALVAKDSRTQGLKENQESRAEVRTAAFLFLSTRVLESLSSFILRRPQYLWHGICFWTDQAAE